MLFEFTGRFWQVGLVVTCRFIFLAALAFRLVSNHTALAEGRGIPDIGANVAAGGWLFYGVPLIFLALAWVFGAKTFEAYNRQGHF